MPKKSNISSRMSKTIFYLLRHIYLVVSCVVSLAVVRQNKHKDYVFILIKIRFQTNYVFSLYQIVTYFLVYMLSYMLISCFISDIVARTIR